MRIFRKLAQMLDVDLTTNAPADGDSLTYDSASSRWVPEAVSGGGGGGSDDQTAAEVPFTPAGTIAATDTQSAVEEVATDAAAAVSALSSVYQPLDSDLTAIAALTTTSFGRGLLILANQVALLSAAGAAAASHMHSESDITNLVSDLAGKQPLDSDLTAIAALTTTTFGRAFLAFADEAAFKAGVNLEAGTDFPSLATFNDHSARHEDGGADEISIAGLDGTPTELTNHLNDTSDAHDASAISNVAAGNIAATDVQAAINELDSEKTTAAAALSAAQTEIADQKRVVAILVSDPLGSAITTGDGKACFRIPTLLNGHNLVSVGASVTTVSSSGIPTVQLRRMRLTNATTQSAADMLSTKLTIDASEFDSKDATTAAVIDTSNDDVATGDQINIDIDVAGTGTKGLFVTLTFEAP